MKITKRQLRRIILSEQQLHDDYSRGYATGFEAAIGDQFGRDSDYPVESDNPGWMDGFENGYDDGYKAGEMHISAAGRGA